MAEQTVFGIRIITKDWMPKGFVAFQNGEPWPDTHTMLLTPTGKVLDFGRPRDLFPPPDWKLAPDPTERRWMDFYND